MLRFRILIFQTAVSSTCRNRFFNPPCFRLLACVKGSVLHFQQSRLVLLCTHVCRWHFFFSTDSGRHEMGPLRFLSVLSSAKKRFLNDKPLKRSNLILKRRNQWRNSKLCGSRSNSAHNEWKFLKFATSHSPCAYSRELSPWQVSLLYSYSYFPHQLMEQTDWNGTTISTPFLVWNQNNRHVRITH